MPEQRIIITIDGDGAITAKTDGFKGDSCLEALDKLLELDGVVSDMKKTADYHQGQVNRILLKQTIKGKSS